MVASLNINSSQRPCGHVTHATLKENSKFVFAPDPVQVFAELSYSQRLEFHLAASAGLTLLDWFSSGRVACGERWEISCFKSCNEVFITGRRAFLDSILLDSSDSSLAPPMRAGRFNCFAMLLLVCEPLRTVASQLLEKKSARLVERKSSLVASASEICKGVNLRLCVGLVQGDSRNYQESDHV